MKRLYKLAANFNTVDLAFDEDDLIDVCGLDEIEWSVDDQPTFLIPESELIQRILQREYDILASIKTVPAIVNNAATPKKTINIPESDKPTQGQIEYARSLGMPNPENSTKGAVWKYIKDHK